MQKKASIPLCFSTVLGGKIGGTVPKKGGHSVFFFLLECNAMQCNAIQYTTIQCNAMQCNAMAQPNARKNAMSCSVPCIRCPRALAMPSSPIFWAYSSFFFYAVLYMDFDSSFIIISTFRSPGLQILDFWIFSAVKNLYEGWIHCLL